MNRAVGARAASIRSSFSRHHEFHIPDRLRKECSTRGSMRSRSAQGAVIYDVCPYDAMGCRDSVRQNCQPRRSYCQRDTTPGDRSGDSLPRSAGSCRSRPVVAGVVQDPRRPWTTSEALVLRRGAVMDGPDVAIVGAGPYGLSIAAHLRVAGVTFRIFGRPMQTWRYHMPDGNAAES